MPELDDPVVVELPLRGEWTILQTPAHRIPSHGTDAFGQRFAYDIVRTDDRAGIHVHPAGTLRWLVAGGRTRDCYGWGQPVHAAAAGEVVTTVDGIAERARVHPLLELWFLYRTTRRFRRAGPAAEPAQLAGNHVIVRTGDLFALYAHLAPGSVAVREGDSVCAGEVVGELGHSGNSTAPHLHFHLMDSADPWRARGVPCAFADYLVQREHGWEPVHAGIPQRLERVRSVD
jgi:hypothetical protein